MIDLTFYLAQTLGSFYLPVKAHPGVWIWNPSGATCPASLEMDKELDSHGWERICLIREAGAALDILCGQLADIRLLLPKNDAFDAGALWAPTKDIQRVAGLPVVLAFALPEKRVMEADKKGIVTSRQAIPPPQLGELGLIANAESASERWTCRSVTELSQKSQELQKRLGAALSRLAVAHNLARPLWLQKWGEIQRMAQQLAADYWSAEQEAYGGRKLHVPNLITAGAEWALTDNILGTVTAGVRNAAEVPAGGNNPANQKSLPSGKATRRCAS